MNHSGNSMYDILSKDLHRLQAILDFLTNDPSWIIYIADTNGQFNLWT